MKTILLITISFTLAACKIPEQNARLGSLVSLAVSIAEARGAITSQDATDIRKAETIILPSIPPLPVSGK